MTARLPDDIAVIQTNDPRSAVCGKLEWQAWYTLGVHIGAMEEAGRTRSSLACRSFAAERRGIHRRARHL